jgi:two-component system copper resistance phosphate regulon response regulator CusR
MRVLIVEDGEEMRAAIARRLRAQGHAVDEAATGEDADHQLSVSEHTVVILDRMLPDGDGLRRLASWRKRGIRTPTLVLTALDDVPDRVQGFEAGADDYLVKPFAMDELLARVAALARRDAQPKSPVLHIGDVELDTARCEVRRKGVLIPLRPKEFALLELLMTNAGTVISRERIYNACWDEASDAVSNVEEVVVASLRRKLGPPSVIRTVRGTGYLFEGDGVE